MRSSEAIDSHGDNVSSDSVRDSRDCRGFTCGAYELLLICAGTPDCFDLGLEDLLDAVSMSVGVSVKECRCCVEAAMSKHKKICNFFTIRENYGLTIKITMAVSKAKSRLISDFVINEKVTTLVG